MTNRTELLEKLSAVRHNPGLIQRTMIDQVEKIYSGQLEIVDATNPFVFLLEAASTMSADAVNQAEILNRRQYPKLAQTYEELYYHMSDKDYLDRFHSPSKTTITLLLGKEELYQRAVPTGAGGVKKITIPRHTSVAVGNYVFGMQYPIDIRIMSHGGLQIVYDNGQRSPLYDLESNRVDWSILNYNAARTEFVKINIPMLQFSTLSFNASLNGVTGFKKTYRFTDQYYHCRVYMSDDNGVWTEIDTTHSDQVFDIHKPTVQLKVIDDQLTVQLPQIYFTTGKVANELRIDIYTTKGPLETTLDAYSTSDFVANFIDRENEDNGKFIAPLTAMSSIAIFGEGVVTGGTSGLSFLELRERVMGNASGNNDIPVTTEQLAARIGSMGFSAVKYLDNVTNRTFLATRMLPKPTIGNVATGVGASMIALNAAFEDLTKNETVVDNGERITLTPKTLYKNDNGRLKTVTSAEMATLSRYKGDKFTEAVNSERYLFSPFHYVLDITGNSFETRPYYFGAPQILKKTFVDENDTLGVGVSTNEHLFERVEDGWVLYVKTVSGEGFKALDNENVHVQLRFMPKNEIDYAYLNGTLVTQGDDKERIYRFDIKTNWDVNQDDHIAITSFKMYDINSRTVFTDLETDFDLVFVVTNLKGDGIRSSAMDQRLGDYLLPTGSYALFEESLKLSLGSALKGLWVRSRTIAGEKDYLRYDVDVVETYKENVYARDLTGAAVIEVVDGKPQFVLKHRIGETVLDSAGEPVILQRKGYPVLDGSGMPVVAAPRKVIRSSDIFVIDGAYYFANTDTDLQYLDSVPRTVVGWLKDTIEPTEKKLIENTDLYYYPKATIGLVDAVINDEEETQLFAEQKLTITYYVTQQVYRNPDLREIIADRTVSTVARLLDKPSVNATEIVSTLKAEMGSDVITAELQGLGGALNNIPVITLMDESSRLCIGKELVAMPDGQYEVKDAVTVVFVKHVSL